MIEMRTILCPVDFSDISKHSLDHAIAIAHRYGSTLRVLYVCPGVNPGTVPVKPEFFKRIVCPIDFSEGSPVRDVHCTREREGGSAHTEERQAAQGSARGAGAHRQGGHDSVDVAFSSVPFSRASFSHPS